MFGSLGLGAGDSMKTRFLPAIAVVVLGLGVSGLAQQSNTFKVKPTKEKPPKQSAPIGKSAVPATASSSNAKSLQSVEHQTAKASTAPGSGKTKTAPALKPVKDKPNPPINFNTSGSSKSSGLTNQSAGSNPYKGRLKQKGAHQ